MAIKKIEMRPKGTGDYADILYPKTSGDMVIMADASTAEAKIATKADQTSLDTTNNNVALKANISDMLTQEVGNWTPILASTGSISGQTYSQQEGSYIKIGNVVTVNFLIALSAKGTVAGTYATINGLPFAVGGTYGSYGVAIGKCLNLASAVSTVSGSASIASTKIFLTSCTAASTTPLNSMPIATIGNTTTVYGSFTYFV